MEVLQRPGGELATRPIHFFWVVDCSGSMYGEKIGIVNNTIQECIPEMRSAADNNPNAQLLIRALQFSSGASWITSSPVPVEDYGWEDMDANGLTELGKAFDLLAAQLSIHQCRSGHYRRLLYFFPMDSRQMIIKRVWRS